VTSCREAALRILSRRARTTAELREKLVKKGFPASEVDETLSVFLARGLLNDLSVAEGMARVKSGRGLGRIRIGLEMKRRGVGPAEIGKALRDIPEDDERASLERAAIRKVRALPARLTAVERSKKLFDHLVRRGFSASAVLEWLRKKGDPR
jgi:regulatory protein